MQHLASADSVSTAYQSISILSTLHKAKTLVKRVGADQIERVIMLFKDLSDSQGRFKPSSTSPRRSILATGLVYRTLADARSLETSLSPDIEETVEEMRASLAQVRLHQHLWCTQMYLHKDMTPTFGVKFVSKLAVALQLALGV